MTLVKASASWAPECTHRKETFSFNKSLIALAVSWVRNSAQLGIAVRLTRSKRDLQSVAAKVSGSCLAFRVAVAYVSGSCFNVWCGDFHLVLGLRIQAQHNRIHERWSRTELSDVVSAAKVLVTTLSFYSPMIWHSLDRWHFSQYPYGWP